MDSIFWYDYETTGVDPARDRVIQFAGVRTSLDLERLEAPVERLCQLGDEVVPHAEALLVSGIRMAELMQSGIPEPGFAQEIHAQFSRPQTCVSGYNSLRFDDEFTRYLFYRNFYDPYAREWQSGNSRWDVIDLFRTAYALRPDGFNWPLTDNVPSFRLELLTSANHVNHGRAHDALSDVIATIDLSRLLKTAQPRLYDYYFSLRFKRNVLDQLYPLGKRAVVHVSGKYPASKGCCAIVLPLCVHPGNGNGIICYDLSQNPEPLLTLSAEEIARRTFTSSAALGDSELRIPLKVIHINRSPSVSPLATLDDSAAGRLGLDKSLCLEHMKR
ncbi:MAG: exodeoxyribonuclease I, partial [Gammaproteobacteria bacterium]|nr:exodeoxyribonuclease I [Gammaproteobacteria bacterium]